MNRKLWSSSGIAASVGALFFLLPTPTHADWPVEYGNSDFNLGTSVATDSAGNVFAGGYTESGLFGESSPGGDDGYVAKFDAAGTLQWSHLLGTSNNDYVFGVAGVGASSVAAAGWTSGALPTFSSAGSLDAMVRLYDGTGATTWTRQFGTSGAENVRAVAADGAGHLYVGGATTGTFSGFSAAGNYDLFVTQLDAATGAVNWTFQLGSSAADNGLGLAADSAGNVFLGAAPTARCRGR